MITTKLYRTEKRDKSSPESLMESSQNIPVDHLTCSRHVFAYRMFVLFRRVKNCYRMCSSRFPFNIMLSTDFIVIFSRLVSVAFVK